jgi:hypothetical protein
MNATPLVLSLFGIITDGFSGKAPDLGALELGQNPPHLGRASTLSL